ncbi:hypothetical protein D3C74_477570 [compost metagenome]
MPTGTMTRRICSGVTRPTSAPLTWLPIVTDTAPAPKMIAYCWALRPNCSWNTNVDAEMYVNIAAM